MNESSTARGLLALAAVLLIWSGITVVLKHLTGVVDPWSMIGVRYTAVLLIMAPLLGRALLKDPSSIPWKAALIPAAIYAPGQILWNIAPYHNPAALIMFIGRCAFFFSAVLDAATIAEIQMAVCFLGATTRTCACEAGLVISERIRVS